MNAHQMPVDCPKQLVETWEHALRNDAGLSTGLHCLLLNHHKGQPRICLVEITSGGDVLLLPKPGEGDMYLSWMRVDGDRLEHRQRIDVITWGFSNPEVMQMFGAPEVVIARNPDGSFESKEPVAIGWQCHPNALQNQQAENEWHAAICATINGWGLVRLERHRVSLVKGHDLVFFAPARASFDNGSAPRPLDEESFELALHCASIWAAANDCIPAAI